MQYTQEYFDNQVEKNRIKGAILGAIPKGTHYHNLIIALAELLTFFVSDSVKIETGLEAIEDQA